MVRFQWLSPAARLRGNGGRIMNASKGSENPSGAKKDRGPHRLPAELSRVNLNAAGIDVGASSHFAAVPQDRWEQPVREFEAFTADLCRLADWLAECAVETVDMESTGVYWIPLFAVLEERGFEVMLVDPSRIKSVPGRKTDVLDCQWLQGRQPSGDHGGGRPVRYLPQHLPDPAEDPRHLQRRLGSVDICICNRCAGPFHVIPSAGKH